MKRKFEKVKRYPGIYRILVSSADGIWREPSSGAAYAAVMDVGKLNGKRQRVKRYFESFGQAKAFKESFPKIRNDVLDSLRPEKNMTFQELTIRWINDKLPHLDRTTQTRYRSYLKHFESINALQVERIDASTIDGWISFVKRPEYLAKLNVTRCGFDHEFTVLRGILNYYASRCNRNYRLPFLKDHNAMLKVREKMMVKKDLSIAEFKKFIMALRELLTGTEHEVIYYVALAQYAIYGRIQDAAALHYEDFDFERNKIYVRRKVQWSRVKNQETLIVDGSKANGGKEVPMNDFAAQIFREWIMKSGVRSGLLFTYRGKVVTYRQIAHRYDQALRQAGLPFTGTHLIRHASLSEHYDTCKDILATAKVAGHSDLRATERYAKARDERVIETQRQMNEKLRDVLPNC